MSTQSSRVTGDKLWCCCP